MKRVDQSALHRVSTGNSYKAHDERAGFVSYDNRDSAEKAISQMNGYQVRVLSFFILRESVTSVGLGNAY